MQGQEPHCPDEVPPVLTIEGQTCSHLESYTLLVMETSFKRGHVKADAFASRSKIGHPDKTTS
jgi:hypothetical protein